MQLKKLEWQRLYPVKKLLFLGAWLFCVFIFVAAIILLVRDGNRENLWLGILCGIAAFVMSCPMIKYIRISYHCMPYFNRIFMRRSDRCHALPQANGTVGGACRGI